ncbi:bifunctional CDK5 and ABL1 enzyme substrate 1-2/Cyclin-like superfamily/Cyclin [Babesia duncani]|uniref:Bifunctional CDK5 and ABL1 enzyme substrate 1-2/Cyclin-like superfamily/Cyclin n=1 Tax=Babesia duncani TaxID=323732 RepID=A0AAD9UN36_9APIC|nr:bifunctional CDK5 and ABL1 enzyme substrate 1-2/Cyclin-like superfamily/Cyclin [Babesia duncani]
MDKPIQNVTDLTEDEFRDVIADLKLSSLQSSNLSANVAMAFLTSIPSYTKVEDSIPKTVGRSDVQTAYDAENFIDFDYDDFEQRSMGGHVLIDHDAMSDADDRKTNLRNRIAKWRESWMQRFKISNSTIVPNNEKPPSEKKRSKFYISYAELIVPDVEYTFGTPHLQVPILPEFCITRKNQTQDFGDPKTQETGSFDYSLHRAELNRKFRNENTWLHPTLSLTKLSKIKQNLLLAANEIAPLDPSSAAFAWTLFERLVIKGTVTKHNRKLYSGTCLVLAYKFNQDGEPDVINNILQHLKRDDKTITPKLVFSIEMKIFTLLDFSLKQNYKCIQSIVHDYLELNGCTFQDLYGSPEDVFIKMDAMS